MTAFVTLFGPLFFLYKSMYRKEKNSHKLPMVGLLVESKSKYCNLYVMRY
jgi:hypothetical protein